MSKFSSGYTSEMLANTRITSAVIRVHYLSNIESDNRCHKTREFENQRPTRMKVVRIRHRQRLKVLNMGDAHVHVPLLLRLLDENVAGGLCGTALNCVGPVRQWGMFSLDLSRCNATVLSFRRPYLLMESRLMEAVRVLEPSARAFRPTVSTALSPSCD